MNPGFGGQSFIEGSYGKIRELRKMIDDASYDVMIQVDGGVDTENAGKLIKAGVNVLVAGNAVFGSADPKKTISQLKHLS